MPDTIQNTPRNGLLGALSDALGWGRAQANNVQFPPGTALGALQQLSGAKTGDVLVGKAPEEIDNWAYGNAPMRMPPAGTGGYIPDFKRTLSLDSGGNRGLGNSTETRAFPFFDALTTGQAVLPLTRGVSKAGLKAALESKLAPTTVILAPSLAGGGSVQSVPRYSHKAALLARLYNKGSHG